MKPIAERFYTNYNRPINEHVQQYINQSNTSIHTYQNPSRQTFTKTYNQSLSFQKPKATRISSFHQFSLNSYNRSSHKTCLKSKNNLFFNNITSYKARKTTRNKRIQYRTTIRSRTRASNPQSSRFLYFKTLLPSPFALKPSLVLVGSLPRQSII